MLGLRCLVLIATVFQMSLAQPPFPSDIPPHCRGPPPDVAKPHECCKVPPLFTDEDLEACGIQKPDDKPPERKFPGPPDCSKQKCILEKYKLLKDDSIDKDAVSDFMDKWAVENPDFKPTIETAKDRCLGELPGPPHICEEDRMIFCIGSTIFLECPIWEDNENCQKLKEHIESCKPTKPERK